MITSRVIEQKRDGGAVDGRTLEAFLGAFLEGSVRDYQMSAFLMAAFHQGLDAEETEVFVRTMLESGTVLDLSYLAGPRIDKHSTSHRGCSGKGWSRSAAGAHTWIRNRIWASVSQFSCRPGYEVSIGDRLATVHATDAEGARTGQELVRRAVTVGESRRRPRATPARLSSGLPTRRGLSLSYRPMRGTLKRLSERSQNSVGSVPGM
jgi:thymidine phosphorylase